MAIFDCRKCLPINVPDDWQIEKKSEIASLVRNTNPISAIQYFRPIKMSLTDAKGIVLHISVEKGLCHKCKTKLAEYEGKCQKCKRLNLDW